MSTVTLKNNAAVNKKENTIKSRIINYFVQNRNTITLGLYAISGKMPDLDALRAMKVF